MCSRQGKEEDQCGSLSGKAERGEEFFLLGVCEAEDMVEEHPLYTLLLHERACFILGNEEE